MPRFDFSTITIGTQYTSKELANLWGYKSHHALVKGIVTQSGNDNTIVLFVTKEKQAGATPYEDRIEGNVLYMMGQERHGTDQKLMRNLPNSIDTIHLFFRAKHHTPFIYYGKCRLLSAVEKADAPSEFEFLLIEQDGAKGEESEEAIIDLLANANDAEIEGRKYISQHIRYERNPQNRRKAILLQGHVCRICGFDFGKVYGTSLADDYIEVHHIRQLSEGQQNVDPSKDLITVCANCHRMLHRRKTNNISVSELQEIESVKKIKEIFEGF